MALLPIGPARAACDRLTISSMSTSQPNRQDDVTPVRPDSTHRAGTARWPWAAGSDRQLTVPTTDNRYERAVLGVVSRASGGAVVALTLLFYPGIALILPLALGWSVPYLVITNAVGALYAAVVGMGWLYLQLVARDRRHLVEWTTNLRLLNPEEFEWLTGELFRRDGWQVTETGRQDRADGNIDLTLRRGGERRLVQCKRWSIAVGVDEIRKFAGTLMREGLPGAAGMFVTLSDFTEQARTEARALGITVIDNRDLFRRVEQARRTEPCPDCTSPMLFGRSPRGWWFYCVAPGCRGKRDLASEPGRAVELLTESR